MNESDVGIDNSLFEIPLEEAMFDFIVQLGFTVNMDTRFLNAGTDDCRSTVFASPSSVEGFPFFLVEMDQHYIDETGEQKIQITLTGSSEQSETDVVAFMERKADDMAGILAGLTTNVRIERSTEKDQHKIVVSNCDSFVLAPPLAQFFPDPEKVRHIRYPEAGFEVYRYLEDFKCVLYSDGWKLSFCSTMDSYEDPIPKTFVKLLDDINTTGEYLVPPITSVIIHMEEGQGFQLYAGSLTPAQLAVAEHAVGSHRYAGLLSRVNRRLSLGSLKDRTAAMFD